MKKRLLSVLLMLCMVYTMLPMTAFAKEASEGIPVNSEAEGSTADNTAADSEASAPTDTLATSCGCTEKCNENTVNADCPVCGLEGADLKACIGTITQSEGESSEPRVDKAIEDVPLLLALQQAFPTF